MRQKHLDDEPNGTVDKRSLQPHLSTGYSIMKRVLFDPLIKGIPKDINQKLDEIVERCFSAQLPTFAEITRFVKPAASKTDQKPPRSYPYR
ncbi:unnamed protein product [Microthlaspi erraticum]|uniref:Uncharacterized protein n=1 Tax=Microthlaspi erraticum TaxID=1685480 RepID=A0A6D2K5X0_9BRAS|nr:unnamed protein product [Microthlaspi erraticum]